MLACVPPQQCLHKSVFPRPSVLARCGASAHKLILCSVRHRPVKKVTIVIRVENVHCSDIVTEQENGGGILNENRRRKDIKNLHRHQGIAGNIYNPKSWLSSGSAARILKDSLAPPQLCGFSLVSLSMLPIHVGLVSYLELSGSSRCTRVWLAGNA